MISEDFLQMAFIPLLSAAGLLYYAIRLLLFRDIRAITGKNKPTMKDEEKYREMAGVLLAFLAVVSLGMAALLLINKTAAVIEVMTGIVIFGILWARMTQKYGKR